MSFLGILGVSLVGVSLLSADVAVVVVRPDVTAQRVFSSTEVEPGLVGTARSEQAVTMVSSAQNREIST